MKKPKIKLSLDYLIYLENSLNYPINFTEFSILKDENERLKKIKNEQEKYILKIKKDAYFCFEKINKLASEFQDAAKRQNNLIIDRIIFVEKLQEIDALMLANNSEFTLDLIK